MLLRIALSAMYFITVVSAAGSGGVEIRSGEDWSFPEWVTPASSAGLYYMDNAAPHPLVRSIGATLTWAELNPADGVYDFSRMEAILERAKQQNGSAIFRCKASKKRRKASWSKNEEGPFMPQWVIDRYNPKEFYTMRTSKEFLLYAAPWDEGVQREFKRFTEEFGRRGYFSHPAFGGIYLHAFSSSLGEEFWLTDDYVDEAVRAGMTPAAVFTCFRDRMEWWAAAAGSNAHKVVWVGGGGIKIDFPRDALNEYATRLGFGERGGFIEHYFYEPIMPPKAGQRYDNGYVVIDWNAPLRDGRFFGDEGEEDDEFGSNPGETELRFMQQSVYFRAAQSGVKYLWVGRKNIEWAPETAAWYTAVAGRGPRTSPDAVCWLREAYIRKIEDVNTARPWKNIERLLMQRDGAGAETTPAVRLELPEQNNRMVKTKGQFHEFSARRTDIAGGQKEMRFYLDAEFAASLTGPAEIRVTYLDDTRSSWVLSVAGENGMETAGTVEHTADGTWKTAVFRAGRLRSPAPLFSAPSFVITASGADVTVRLVRVVRTTPPRILDEITARPAVITAERPAISFAETRIEVPAGFITLEASADALIRGGKHESSSFGASQSLETKNSAGDYNRQALLQFDLSSLSGDVAEARMMLGVITASPLPVRNIAKRTEDNWDDSVTWSSAPQGTETAAEWSVGAPARSISVDLTRSVREALAAGRKRLSLRLEAADRAQDQQGGTVYASRENVSTGLRPKLLIRMK